MIARLLAWLRTLYRRLCAYWRREPAPRLASVYFGPLDGARWPDDRPYADGHWRGCLVQGGRQYHVYERYCAAWFYLDSFVEPLEVDSGDWRLDEERCQGK